jgi:hypothetical protein
MAGKSFIKEGQAGIGTQTTAERTAGVSTATGTVTFDVDDAVAYVYTGNTDGWVVIGEQATTIVATGGQKFTVSSDTYHIFMNPDGGSQTFTVSSGQGTCECLIVGGGGASRADNGGAGGGGGVVHAPALSFGPGSYAVTVGYGGTYNPARDNSMPTWGGHSKLTHPVGTITAYGGQGAQNAGPAPYPFVTPWAGPGGNTTFGSGAGGAVTNPTSEVGTRSPISNAQPSAPNFSGNVTNYGSIGGAADPGALWNAGGGGGAGGDGTPSNPNQPAPTRGDGGPGQPFTNFPGPGLYPNLPSPASSYLGTAWRDALGPTGLFGGGGGGSLENPSTFYQGGPGGGSPGADSGTPGINGTGGGMGSLNNTTSDAKQGGDGIVIIKYSS